MNAIDTGDTVLHTPTGETWTVAREHEGRLWWCGWPPGMARTSDCLLKKTATPEQRAAILAELARSQHAVADWAARRMEVTG